jgi:hypothetical protein
MTEQINDFTETVFTLEKKIFFPMELRNKDFIQRLNAFLLELVESLKKSGCKLIGHIKGTVGTVKQNKIFFNITSFEQAPQYKGELQNYISHVTLTINVIVFMISKEKVERIVNEGLSNYFT